MFVVCIDDNKRIRNKLILDNLKYINSKKLDDFNDNMLDNEKNWGYLLIDNITSIMAYMISFFILLCFMWISFLALALKIDQLKFLYNRKWNEYTLTQYFLVAAFWNQLSGKF